jgi:hypothetical protein
MSAFPEELERLALHGLQQRIIGQLAQGAGTVSFEHNHPRQ